VPVEIGVEAVEGVVPLLGPALQILLPTGKARGEGVKESTNAAGEETTKSDEKPLTWKTCHTGPLWIRSASFSARLSEAPWS
jgi:hypothetical protein